MSLTGIAIWVGWILSLCLREFSHMLTAYWGGDTSVKSKGYLIFNPLRRYAHVSPIHRVVFLLIFLLAGGVWLPGGTIYINQRELMNRYWQSAVSAARPITNILIALILSICFRILTKDNLGVDTKIGEDLFLPVSMAFLIYLQILTALFNLLPIPGLDGYGIIEPWLSNHTKSQFNYLKKYSTLIVVGLLWWSIFTFRAIELLIDKVLQTPGVFIEAGLFCFQQTIYLVASFVVFMYVIWDWGLNHQEPSINKDKNSVKKKVTVPNQSYSQPHGNSSQKQNTVKAKVPFSSQVDPETRKRAIAFAGYDKERIERLLNGARLKNPDRSEQWYWEKILYDMERDRGF
jgi:Zn-dependent protease